MENSYGKFVVNGCKTLNGDVYISGSKNAAVAIIPATILIDGECRIENVPDIGDVKYFDRCSYKYGS